MKLIAITGADGSGKSTICKNLVEYFKEQGKTCEVSVSWDTMGELAKYSNGGFSKKEEVQNYLMSCKSESRLFFLYHALMRSLEMAKEKNPDYIIVDGYWYKYALSEVVYGLDKELVLAAAKVFDLPDFKFFLDIEPASALKRKSELSQYETGGSKDKEDFLKSQTKQYQLWKDFIQDEFEIIDANQSPTEVLNALVAKL